MALFYSDEDFSLPVVRFLREFGHDVLTAFEAGNANKMEPDESVLAFAMERNLIVLTHNRKHFRRLHRQFPDHSGIVICTRANDFESLAGRINNSVLSVEDWSGRLLKVYRPNQSQVKGKG